MLGFEEFTIGKVIESLKPNIIAFGYDQKTMEQETKEYVRKHGLRIRVVEIGKFSSDELDSSSKIKHRIIEEMKR